MNGEPEDRPDLVEALEQALGGGGIDAAAVGLPPGDRQAVEEALSGLRFLRGHLEPEEASWRDPPIDPLKSRLEIGEYDLLELIGAGGMGMVYRARQRSLGRAVALKVLPLQMLARPESRRRFIAEAQVASRLRHPNIVAVHSLEEREGFFFYSMDHIPGISLHGFIEALRKGTIPEALSPALPGELLREHERGRAGSRSPAAALGPEHCRFAARIVRDLALALEYAHREGVVHRDIKPANILLDERAKPYLCDFGLAKDLLSADIATASADVLGTLAYLAPERLRRKEDRGDPRGDIYSLCLTLYELLTLHQPFLLPTQAATLKRVEGGDVPLIRQRNPRVPRDLELLALRGMEKDPVHRHRSAGELAADLDRFLEGKPIASGRSSAFRRGRWLLRRHRRKIGALAGAAGIVLAALAWPKLAGESREELIRQLDSELASVAALHEGGTWEEALPKAREAIEAARSLGDRERIAEACFRCGQIEYLAAPRDPAAGLDHLVQACRYGGDGRWGCLAWLQLAEYGLLLGKTEAAGGILDDVKRAALAKDWADVWAWRDLLEVRLSISTSADSLEAGRRIMKFDASTPAPDPALASASPTSIPAHIVEERRLLERILDAGSIRSFPISAADPGPSGIAIGQIDGGGPLEVVVATTENLSVHRFAGHRELGPVAAAPIETPCDIILSVVLADLDGDSRAEIVLGLQKNQVELAIDVWRLDGGGSLRKLPEASVRYPKSYNEASFIFHLPAARDWPPLLCAVPWGGVQGIDLLALREGKLVRFTGFTVPGEMAAPPDAAQTLAEGQVRYLTAVIPVEIDGREPYELVASAGGYREGTRGIKVYRFVQEDRTYRILASDLVHEGEGTPSAVFTCAALARPLGGEGRSNIIGGRKGLTGHELVEKYQPGAYGGPVSYRIEEAGGRYRLQEESLRFLAKGLNMSRIAAGSLLGSGDGDPWAAAIRRSNNSEYLMLFFPGPRHPFGWSLPLFLEKDRPGRLPFAVGDIDGDSRDELVCLGVEPNLLHLVDLNGGK